MRLEWAACLYVLLSNKVNMPPEVLHLVQRYSTLAPMTTPLSYVEYLDDNSLWQLYQAHKPEPSMGLLVAVLLEAIGAAAIPFTHEAYLACICISRACLVSGHLDLPWALCFAHGTIPRRPYPIPLVWFG